MKNIRTLLSASLLFVATSGAASEFPEVEQFIDKAQIKQAMAALQKADKTAHPLAWQIKHAMLTARSGNPEAAQDQINDTLKAFPDSPKAQLLYGQIQCQLINEVSFFSKKGQAEKCLNAFKDLVKKHPEFWQGQVALAQFYAQAPGIAGGDTELAIKHAEALKELNFIEGASLLARIYQSEDEPEKATQQLEALQQKHADDPQVWAFMGYAEMQQENYAKAIEYYAKASELPAETQYQKVAKFGSLYQLGKASMEGEKELDKGIQALNAYIQAEYFRRSPPMAWAEFRLASLYLLKGEKVAAKKQLLAINTEDDDELKKKVKKALKKLKRVKV